MKPKSVLTYYQILYTVFRMGKPPHFTARPRPYPRSRIQAANGYSIRGATLANVG